MISLNTGAVKFTCDRVENKSLNINAVGDLTAAREQLYHRRLIGVYPEGVAYGNISKRVKLTEFIITGTGTGGIRKLLPGHYSTVLAYDFTINRVKYTGMIIPSSESLTHAAIYESSPAIGSVIHIHHSKLWKWMLSNHIPKTSESAEYGTPELALEIKHLLKDSPPTGVIVMGGHKSGVICFGSTIRDALNIVLKFADRIR